ncbi:MAG: Gfo/Idh/MocA family protein [Terricaulis sp.]
MTPKLTEIRIGCLGAARIAPRALVEPAREIAAVTLQSIAARDHVRACAFAEKFGFAASAADYDALVADPSIDLVYVALPTDLHFLWTMRALAAGKHVLCEKPFAMNAAQAKAAVSAGAAADLRVIEALHYRYHPSFQILLDWLQAGRIGPVRRIKAHFNVPIDPCGGLEFRHHPEHGGGAFMDLGCYPLSWALMIMGEAPASVKANALVSPSGVDEALSAELEFSTGVRAFLSASMAMGQPASAHLRVEGENGVVDFVNPVAPHLGASLSITSGKSTEAALIDPMSTFYHQLRRIVGALKEGSSLPTEGDMIVRQQRALDQIYVAAGLGHLRSGAS